MVMTALPFCGASLRLDRRPLERQSPGRQNGRDKNASEAKRLRCDATARSTPSLAKFQEGLAMLIPADMIVERPRSVATWATP